MGPTQGQGQQNGDAHVGGNSILEIDQWEFTPTQKLGSVVTNATGGFEGQIRGAMGGKGSVRIVVPKTGYTAPIVAGSTRSWTCTPTPPGSTATRRSMPSSNRPRRKSS